jgi:hypothetical protein
MKRLIAVGAGLVGGVLLAGMVTAAIVPWLPTALRGPTAVWSVAVVSVALAVWVAWAASAPRRD